MSSKEIEGLSEEERRALRGSKFASLPSIPPSSRSSKPRLAHPGGALTTNKAAALARFLERKLQDPNGLSSIDPHLIESAVQNAKATFFSSGSSSSGRTVRHMDSFGDSEDSAEKDKLDNLGTKELKKKKKKKKEKRGIKVKIAEDD